MGLEDILNATDGAGKRLYTDDTVRDFMALVGIATNDKRLAPLVARFKKHLEREMNDGTFDARVEKYFEKHPLPDQLTAELARAVREEMAAESPMAASASKVTGQVSSSLPISTKPMQGAVRGGVFARVTMNKGRT